MTSWTSKFTIEGSLALCVHYTRGWEGRTYLYGNKTLFWRREVKRHKMSQTAETLPTQYHRGQLQREFPLQLPSISSRTMVIFSMKNTCTRRPTANRNFKSKGKNHET